MKTAPLNSGRMKLFYTAAILNFRKRIKPVQVRQLRPIEAEGVMKPCKAFARQYEMNALYLLFPDVFTAW